MWAIIIVTWGTVLLVWLPDDEMYYAPWGAAYHSVRKGKVYFRNKQTKAQKRWNTPVNGWCQWWLLGKRMKKTFQSSKKESNSRPPCTPVGCSNHWTTRTAGVTEVLGSLWIPFGISFIRCLSMKYDKTF